MLQDSQNRCREIEQNSIPLRRRISKREQLDHKTKAFKKPSVCKVHGEVGVKTISLKFLLSQKK